MKNSIKLTLSYAGIGTLLLFFCYRIWNLGITSTDDAGWYLHALQGDWSDGKNMATYQGRVWAFVSGPIEYVALYLHGSVSGEILRVGCLATFFLLYHFLVSVYLTRSIAFMSATLNLALYAMRWEGSMVTTYPAMFGVLASFFLLAVWLGWRYANSAHSALLYAALALFFVSLFMHEGVSVLFSILFLLSILRNHYLVQHEFLPIKSIATTPTTRRLLVGATGAICGYFIIYIGWRWAFPSNYNGNMLGNLALSRIIPTLVAQSTSGSVLSDLIVPYFVRFGDPVMQDGYTVTYLLFSYLKGAAFGGPVALLAGLISFVVVFVIASSVRDQPERNGNGNDNAKNIGPLAFGGLLLGGIVAFVPILPVAMSLKYQQQYFDVGIRSHVYTGLSHFGISLAIGSIILWFVSLLPARRSYRDMISAGVAIFVGVLAYCGYQMNDAIANDIRIETSRWKGVDQTIKIALEINPDLSTIYSPRLSFGSWFTGLQMNYWSQYASTRYKKSIAFRSDTIPIGEIRSGGVVYMDFTVPRIGASPIVTVAPLEIVENNGPVVSNRISISIENLDQSDLAQYVLSFTDLKRGPVSVRFSNLKSSNIAGTIRAIQDVSAIPTSIRVDRASLLQSIRISCDNPITAGASIAVGNILHGANPTCLGDVVMDRDEFIATDWNVIESYLGKPTKQFSDASWKVISYPFNVFSQLPVANNQLPDPLRLLFLPKDISHIVGQLKRRKNSVLLEAAIGNVGHLAYGPYLKLRKGKYEVAFHVATGLGGGQDKLGTVDVAFGGGNVVTSKSVTGENNSQLVTLLFDVMKDDERYEFRMLSNGVAPLGLKAIMVRSMMDQ